MNGAGAPGPGTGSDGDFYLNNASTCLYGPKASGAWPGACASLIGPTGAAGATGAAGGVGANGSNGSNGNTVLSGTSGPSSGQGVDGDFFLRTDTHCLWGPKTSGEWPGTCTSLIGPVNTAAVNAGQKGSYYPYGIGYSSAGSAYFGVGGANHGVRIPLTVLATLEFRSIGVYITAASGTCSGTCGAVITIRSNNLTSIVVQTAVLVSGGTPNINAGTQGVGFPVSSGSAVTGGVATLPAGSYWLCFDSDSTTLAISNVYTTQRT